MTYELKLLLASHVVAGILGIAAFYVVWLHLFREKRSMGFLKFTSISGVIFLVLSWLTGGYYYAMYYGKAVRNIVKDGKYPWAHTVFMESKEHLFLFLPFLALAVAIILLTTSQDKLDAEPVLKRRLSWVAGLIVILGIIVTLSGAIVSGAVRQ